ncbi:Arm DNA-binding domain-containing protein [Neisseria sicca]|uniref:Arm DNA-binding domain-containing protein n=1 Tax=Neisseria sicca TaxID=490 RepID=UPI001145635F
MTGVFFEAWFQQCLHATKLREEICTRQIAIGVFDYAEFFPHSKRAEGTESSPTFREMAEAWLATVKPAIPLHPIPLSRHAQQPRSAQNWRHTDRPYPVQYPSRAAGYLRL